VTRAEAVAGLLPLPADTALCIVCTWGISGTPDAVTRMLTHSRETHHPTLAGPTSHRAKVLPLRRAT
jgi:hypothetical protein